MKCVTIAFLVLACIMAVSGLNMGCTSPIYCSGDFLSRMQMVPVEVDSKTFVDRPLKAPPAEVLAAFALLPPSASGQDLKAFANQWMYPAGYEVVAVEPVDWVPEPEFVKKLPSNSLRSFGLSLHSKWRELVRTFNFSGLCDDCHSSIHVPHPFVVAGGRFHEFYYWDSMWILEGLLVSNMTTTARNVIENLLYMVDTYGFVPNGGRIYYLNRSQPPVLSLMVKLYFDATGDESFLRRALPTLEAEQLFWNNERAYIVTGNDQVNYRVQRYQANTNEPRPESYREDIRTAVHLPTPLDRSTCYRNLASGAETGWDFSSRWLRDFSSLETIRTESLLPVDLNSILYAVEESLATMYDRVGNSSKANQWRKVASDRKAALKNVFFDPYTSAWRDVDIDDTSSASNFYPSTLTPIWARAQHQSPEETLNIYKRLWPKIIFPGGMPTSLINSKQQWDFPNAWAPLQQFVIDGLDSLNLPEATQMADQLANVWFTTNYCAWLQSLPDGGLFFEKYDVTKVGSAGGGGEYKVQAGFGWTNGVLLKLLATRGSRLEIGPCH